MLFRSVSPSKIKVEEYLKTWMEIHSQRLKPRTAESYLDLINRYINPRIGNLQLSQIRPSHLQALYLDLGRQGGNGGSPLSSRTVNFVAAILRKALKHAVEVEGLIPINPASKVSAPRGIPQQNEPFSPAQMKSFLVIIQEHRLYALFRLAIYSGARKGELLALRWDDLDFDTNRVNISKNRVVVAGKSLVQETTKGGEGRRSIPIDPATKIGRAHV